MTVFHGRPCGQIGQFHYFFYIVKLQVTVKLMKNTDYKIELSVPWHFVNSGSVHFRYSYIHKMTSPPIVT